MNALFVVMTILWLLLSTALVVWVFTSAARLSKNFKKRVDRKIMRLAKSEDFLVIHSVSLTDGEDPCRSDYFLIGDKFCYAVMEKKIAGALSGELQDNLWNNDAIDGRRSVVENLLKRNKRNALAFDSYLQGRSVGECQFVIPVVVVPNQLAIDPALKSEWQNSYLFKLKDLKKGIRSIESHSKIVPLSKESVYRIRDAILPLSQR